MEPITKEQLRGLKAKKDEERRIAQRNEDIQKLTNHIRNNILRIASTGQTDDEMCMQRRRGGTPPDEAPTKYFYNALHQGRQGPSMPFHTVVLDIAADVIENLRETFPDCFIELRNWTSIEGSIVQRGILVDWS
jgi:hypothetical protein